MADLGDLSGFKTYEEWQRANRAAGGPGESAQVRAHFEGGSGGQPGYQLGLARQGDPGTQEQQNTARLPAGSFPDDSPDAGNANTGDPYLDELRSGRVAGSEDWRRFSNAQLKEWEKDYLGGGKFRTHDGGVGDKPDESTQGFSGGGGGGRGGGGQAQPGAPGAPATPAKEYDPLQARLMEMFGGGEGMFATDRAAASELEGGGVWWGAGNAPAAATNTPAANPALVDATLNAFTPAAPSQRSATQAAAAAPASSGPVASATQSLNTAVGNVSKAQNVAAPVSQPTQPVATTDPLNEALQKRFPNPNKWWAGETPTRAEAEQRYRTY